MEALKKGVYSIIYQGVNITADIASTVTSVTYTDNLHGESDEIDIRIADPTGKWRKGWYPTKGDRISMAIGWEGEVKLNCGTFQLDEMEFNFSPDSINLRGISTEITEAVRQKNTVAYENVTLETIANKIAADHGYQVVGNFDGLWFERITQNGESSISFLRRLAEQYGYIFKITDSKLVFYKMQIIDAASAVATITRGDISGGSLRDVVRDLYRACEVSYLDPKTGETYTREVADAHIVKGDVLKINERAESQYNAEQRAAAELYRVNAREVMGSLDIKHGSPRLLAGSACNLSGFGALDGKYMIDKSRHTIDRSGGYKTSVDVRRVHV